MNSSVQSPALLPVALAQQDIRQTYLGGFAGQLVSGLLWLASAAAATWGTTRMGKMLLVVGGFFIFPLTLVVLRMMGHAARPIPGNPLQALGMQVAFTLPLSLPVVGAATLYRDEWFYPAFMIVLGAHYLPFVFLYGMRLFGVLAALLVASGLYLGTQMPEPSALGGWLTGLTLLAFAFLGRAAVEREPRAESREPRAGSREPGAGSRSLAAM